MFWWVVTARHKEDTQNPSTVTSRRQLKRHSYQIANKSDELASSWAICKLLRVNVAIKFYTKPDRMPSRRRQTLTDLLCCNRVWDFSEWKAVFAPHAKAHRDAGLPLRTLWISVGVPDNVFFVFRRRSAYTIQPPPTTSSPS
jgi:hypothetical protein